MSKVHACPGTTSHACGVVLLGEDTHCNLCRSEARANDVELAKTGEVETMPEREAKCAACGEKFSAAAKGKIPKKCLACRAAGPDSSRKAPPRKARAKGRPTRTRAAIDDPKLLGQLASLVQSLKAKRAALDVAIQSLEGLRL